MLKSCEDKRLWSDLKTQRTLCTSTYISVKSDICRVGSHKSTGLTSTGLMGTIWLSCPQWQSISSLLCLAWGVSDLLFYVWMTIRCSSASPWTCAMLVWKHALSCCLHFPATPREDVSRLNPKYEIPVFFFYFNYMAKEQSTSSWKVTLTKRIQHWERLDEKCQKNGAMCLLVVTTCVFRVWGIGVGMWGG